MALDIDVISFITGPAFLCVMSVSLSLSLSLSPSLSLSLSLSLLCLSGRCMRGCLLDTTTVDMMRQNR
jgi:hypothetical protein